MPAPEPLKSRPAESRLWVLRWAWGGGLDMFLSKIRGLFDCGQRDRYFANDLETAVNEEGLRRIREARAAFDATEIDVGLRQSYELTQSSSLPGVKFDAAAFEKIRLRAIAALADASLSPCSFLHGNQAERQGIPRSVITHDVRRYTSDVASIIPDVMTLFNPEIVRAIQSSIGSNFMIEDVFLTRNYHVEPEINSKYEILSDRWHFDHQYPDGFSLFVCLSSVTEADGPFHLISAEDSRTALNRGFNPSLRKESPNGGLRPEDFKQLPSYAYLAGPPGAMMLCHTSYCLHRAGVPDVGHIRDMMIFTFRPSIKMDLAWPKIQ